MSELLDLLHQLRNDYSHEIVRSLMLIAVLLLIRLAKRRYGLWGTRTPL